MKLNDAQHKKLRYYLMQKRPSIARQDERESSRIEGETCDGDRDVLGYRVVAAFIQRGLGDQKEIVRQVLDIAAKVQNDNNLHFKIPLFSFGWDDGFLHGKGRARNGGPNIPCDGWVKELCDMASAETSPVPQKTPSLFPPAKQTGAPLKVKEEDLLIFFCKDRSVRLTDEAMARYVNPLKHAVWIYCEDGKIEMALGIKEAVSSAITVDEYGALLGDLLRVHIAKDASLKTLETLLAHPGAAYHSTPKAYSTRIKDRSEKAYQRAIALSGTSVLDNSVNVKWLDIELPVIFTPKARRPSLDLIGDCSDGRLVLCELKFGKSKNNPTYALFELLIYYYHIWRNSASLQKSKIWHSAMHSAIPPFDWNKCNSPGNVRLIVVADDAYWNSYTERKQAIQAAKEIRAALPLLCVKFFNAPPPQVTFTVQSGGNQYTPTLGGHTQTVWKEITT